MNSITGTWRLIRLALRRDRIKLPAWILVIVLMVAGSIPSVLNFYASNAQDRMEYALTNASSLIGRLFNGPIGGPQLGEIATNETFMTAAVLAAFMSTLAVVRHTRQNEETGRLELIGSAVVGRYASLVAALAVAVGANILLGLIIAGSLIAQDLPTTGSIGYGASLAAIGITFAAVAAVTSQMSSTARGANSLAAVMIGVFFLLRGFGDSIGHLTADKLGVVSAWPSWLSPLGWGQQIHFYTKQEWWIFGLFSALILALTAAAFLLNARRDIGSGLIADRKGPAHASPRLLSSFGLAWRLQKGILKGWIAVVIVLGMTIGLVVKEFASLFTENKDLAEYLANLGGHGTFEDVFFGGMILYMCIVLAAYVAQTLQRLRSEESSGRLEPVLATSTGKYSVILSHAACALIGIVTLVLLLGLSSSITYVLYADASWSLVPKLIEASLVQLPAILVVGGFAVASFAIVPRASIALGWSAFGLCLFIGQFADLLKLPQAIKDISPFTHTPTAPAEAITFLPLALLSVVAVGLTVLGLVWFRQRDVISG